MLALALGALVLTVLLAVLGGPLGSVALVPWVALAVAAVADVALSARRKGRLEIDAPSEIFVGDEAVLTLTDMAPRPGQRVRFAWPDGLEGPAEAAFGAGRDVAVRMRAARRGTWAMEHLWLSWPSRLSLFEFVPRVPIEARFRVVPNIRLIQSGALTAKVVSTLFGVKENRAIGEGSEFHQLRDFTAGMDVKSIDWKRSARKRSLLAKELRAERNHHVMLALDTGYLMGEEVGGLPKIDHAVTAALALAWSATLGGDMVGHFAYDVRPRAFARPMAGRAAFVRMRSWAAELDYAPRETNHTLALTELGARMPKRSLIVVFTDFVDTTSAELMLENIGILARRHLIVFVAIRDPEIEGRLSRRPEGVADMATIVATSQSVSERRVVLERLGRMGVTVIDALPRQVTGRVISAYLDIVERELV